MGLTSMVSPWLIPGLRACYRFSVSADSSSSRALLPSSRRAANSATVEETFISPSSAKVRFATSWKNKYSPWGSPVRSHSPVSFRSRRFGGLLAGSHVFALGSIVDSQGTSDTLPTVIAEAMACGLPVVSTRLAGIPEMVDEEKTGLLVEPGRCGSSR